MFIINSIINMFLIIFNFFHLLSLKSISVIIYWSSKLLMTNYYQIYTFNFFLIILISLICILSIILFITNNNAISNNNTQIIRKIFKSVIFLLIFSGFYKISIFLIKNNIHINNFEIINIFFLLLLSYSLFCITIYFSKKLEILEIFTGLFFISICILFHKNLNSLFFFYFVIEIFSVYFFILIFAEKKNSLGSIKFYAIIINIVGSILVLSLLFVYYNYTGCLELHSEFLIENKKLINIFNILYFSFLFIKLGYFLVLPIYVNFYSYISIKPVFFSIIIIKSLIIWFYLNNFNFFNTSIKIWYYLNPNFYSFFLNSIIISILLGVHFAKQLIKSKPIILLFLTSFISSQIILIFFLNNIYSISNFLSNSILFQYVAISTFLLIFSFFVNSDREFYFIILLVIGFPGPLFFIKIGFFNLILINALGIYIIFLSLISLFLVFIQEFFFSFKKNKFIYFNSDNYTNLKNSILFIYGLIFSGLLAFFCF